MKNIKNRQAFENSQTDPIKWIKKNNKLFNNDTAVYELNSDGSIDVLGNVNLPENLIELPVFIK